MEVEQRLLTTTADDVPDAMRDTLRAFCEATPEVESAWVCRIESRAPGREAEERLRFAVKLKGRYDVPDEGVAGARLLMSRLSEPQRELIAELGLAVLADRAVAAWDAKAEMIYRRAASPA